MKCAPRSSTRAESAAPLALIVFLFLSFAAAAQEPLPRLEPSPEAFSRAVAGASDWRAALELGLWASALAPGSTAPGTAAPDPGAAARNDSSRAAVAAAVSEIARTTAGMDERAKGEAVLEYMHKRFLTSYVERQTRLDVLFSNGRFNCVSSAVLYLILGEAVGLRVSGVVTSDHAFCSVKVGVEDVDVETTSPYGFDPGGKKEFHDSFGRVTGFAYVPQRNYRDRSPIGGTELVALILSNRIADLDAAGRYADSVGLGVDRWVLQGGERSGSPKARDDLIVRLTNYGAFLVKTGREERALQWAEAAVAAYGPDRRWTDFVSAAANNLLVMRLRAGRVEAARAELERLRPALAPAAARELDALVGDAELVAAAERGDQAEIAAAVAAARAAKALPDRRIREVEVYARMRALEAVARAEGWAAAYAAAQAAVAELGTDPQLENARRTYRANRIAELHNGFARLYNSGAFAEAKERALAALAEFPDEQRFRSLADTAEKARVQSAR
jgi:hypothetical protein